MFLVPLLLLASTLHAGPERAITQPLPDASPSSQLITGVAAGDLTALVVWEEESGRSAAARVDRDGRRLDPHPIALAAGGRAARGHDRWLVAGFFEGRELAIAGGGVPIAVYMRELPSPLPQRWRVFARTLGETAARRRTVRH